MRSVSRSGPRGASLTRFIAGLALASLLLVACETGDTAEGPTATASASAGSTESPTGLTPTPGATGTSTPLSPDADVLRVAVNDPSTLDPMRAEDPGSVLVVRQLYEGLTRWDPVEEKVLPAAAESWKVRDEGATFRFKLRPDLTFHDGTPVTSADFAFAFNRIARKNSASNIAYTLDLVKGFQQVNQLGRINELAGVKAPDPATLVIELDEPYYDLPAVLTHPGLVPLSEAAVDDLDKFLREPIGNGPFKMAEPWTPGEEISLHAFEEAIEPPLLDGMRFIPFDDASSSWLQFVDEELDVAEVPADQIGAATEAYGENGVQPLLAGYYYGLNIRSKALRSRPLRTAISRAIDRETISRTIYRGTLQAPRGIVPSGMPGFRENVCLRLCKFSPEVAERVIDKLPPKKRNVTLEYTKGSPHAQVAAAIERNLTDVGLRVKRRSFEIGRYLKHLRKGNQSVYRYGWFAEYPVPDVFLSSLFFSTSPDNHASFVSPKVDKLLLRAHKERSDDKRLELYQKAEKVILRDVPIVPIGSLLSHWAAQTNIDGIVFDTMGGFDSVGISLANE